MNCNDWPGGAAGVNFWLYPSVYNKSTLRSSLAWRAAAGNTLHTQVKTADLLRQPMDHSLTYSFRLESGSGLCESQLSRRAFCSSTAFPRQMGQSHPRTLARLMPPTRLQSRRLMADAEALHARLLRAPIHSMQIPTDSSRGSGASLPVSVIIPWRGTYAVTLSPCRARAATA